MTHYLISKTELEFDKWQKSGGLLPLYFYSVSFSLSSGLQFSQ